MNRVSRVARLQRAPVALVMLGCLSCDGGTSSLFERRTSIADQIAAAANANVPFTATPEPADVDTVRVSESATLSLTPVFTVGDARDQHPLRFTGGISQVLPLRGGRIVMHDQPGRQLHVVDSTGRLVSSQSARIPSQHVLTRLFRNDSYILDMVARGDTLIAYSLDYSRDMAHRFHLLVAGQPALTRPVAELPNDAYSAQINLRGVSASLDVFVERTVWLSGARQLARPEHVLFRLEDTRPDDPATRILQYTRADSALTVNDGSDAGGPLFGSTVSIAMSDSAILLKRDSTARIEVFAYDGGLLRSVVLEATRLAVTDDVFARRRDAYFASRGDLDSALKVAMAVHPFPPHQPLIRGLFAAPDGHLLVLRDDLGWDAPQTEQRHVFDVFDASFRHLGRGSVPRAESIKLFAPPMLCTTHYQPESSTRAQSPRAPGEAPPRRGLVSCYRMGPAATATP